MFQKVLVAEDMSSINQGVSAMLKTIGVLTANHAQYCDEAFLLLRKAQKDNKPYELLICDMSFKKDHRDDSIKNGEALIKLAKSHQPELKIIAYSIEDKLAKVKRLFEEHNIDGYVCKDRNGLTELEEAVKKAYNDEKFASPLVASALDNNAKASDFTDYDATLLQLIADGYTQNALAAELKSKGLKPNSLSSIEKRLSILKTMFGSKNTIHLVATTKDLGLI